MMQLAVDIGLALAASLLLSWFFLRLVHEHGPWRKPWAFGLVIFLFAWAGAHGSPRDWRVAGSFIGFRFFLWDSLRPFSS